MVYNFKLFQDALVQWPSSPQNTLRSLEDYKSFLLASDEMREHYRQDNERLVQALKLFFKAKSKRMQSPIFSFELVLDGGFIDGTTIPLCDEVDCLMDLKKVSAKVRVQKVTGNNDVVMLESDDPELQRQGKEYMANVVDFQHSNVNPGYVEKGDYSPRIPLPDE